jgi:hypothetical protein
VTLAEELRPWHAAGILWLLRDEDASVAGSEIPFAGEEDSGATPTNRLAPAERTAAVRSGEDFSCLSPERISGDPPPSRRETASPSFPAGTSPGQSPLPSAWKELLEKTPAAPLLWTYAELGQDLQGRGEGARTAGLRELIGRLGLLRGSSAFWPLTLEDSWAQCLETGAPPPDAPFFLHGLLRLRPRAVIFFGEHSRLLSGLALSARLPFTQEVKDGRLFLLMPAWRDLLAGERIREQAVAYLQAAFSALPGLRVR